MCDMRGRGGWDKLGQALGVGRHLMGWAPGLSQATAVTENSVMPPGSRGRCLGRGVGLRGSVDIGIRGRCCRLSGVLTQLLAWL